MTMIDEVKRNPSPEMRKAAVDMKLARGMQGSWLAYMWNSERKVYRLRNPWKVGG